MRRSFIHLREKEVVVDEGVVASAAECAGITCRHPLKIAIRFFFVRVVCIQYRYISFALSFSPRRYNL